MTEKNKPVRSYSSKERKGLFGEGAWQAHFDNVLPRKGGKITCGVKLLKSGKLVNSSRVNLDTANSRNALAKGLPPEEMKDAKEFLTLLQVWLEAELTKLKKTEKQESKEKPNENREADPRRPLHISDREYVLWTPDLARLVRTGLNETTGKEEVKSDRYVIINPPRPKRRLIIDEEVFVEVEDEGKIVTMTVTQLHQHLRDRGRVTLGSRSMDVLSLICSRLTEETYVGHATYGVYSEDGKLVICETPHPMKEKQREVQRQIKDNINYVPTQADIQAHVDFLKFFHPYEILDKYGLGFSAPYNPVLRGNNVLVPHVLSIGPADVGKTAGDKAVSVLAYGIKWINGESINSDFRRMSNSDSCCAPLTVEEAEDIKPELWSLFKDSAESWHAGERGKADLSTVSYNSRATMLLSCNEFPLTGREEILKRFHVIRSSKQDQAERADTEKKEKFDRSLLELHSIAFQLQRWWVEAHPTEEELLRTIRDYERLIGKEYEKQGHKWMSPQRAQGWAVSYLGLKIFELACVKKEVAWRAPTIAWFVEHVVTHIEEMTWSQSRSNVSLFASWFTMFLAINKRPIRTTTGELEFIITGQDEIWCYGEVTVEGRTDPIKGEWVAMPMVDRHEKENRDAHKYTLIELGKEAADKASIPYDKVLKFDAERKTWVTINKRMGDGNPKAVFIPDSLDEGWEIQTRPDQFEKDDGNEWKGLLGESVTQCHPMSPMKVTEEIDHLDNSNSKACNQVTHDTHAHKGEKNIAEGDEEKRVEGDAESRRGADAKNIFSPTCIEAKIGLQGDKPRFSGVWPSVTQVGDNGLLVVTKQPEMVEEQPQTLSEAHSSAPTQLDKHSVTPTPNSSRTPSKGTPEQAKPLPRNTNGKLTDHEGQLLEEQLHDLEGRVVGRGHDVDHLNAALQRTIEIQGEGGVPTVFELRRDVPAGLKGHETAVLAVLDLFGSEIIQLGKTIHKYRKHQQTNGGRSA
jgi:hypothetical protein